MNRQMRRLVEREERRQKKQGKDARQRRIDQTLSTRGKKGGAPRPPWYQRIGVFLREVRTELSRVSWPTSRQLVNFTAVTVVTSVVLTLVIFGLDVALKQIVLYLLGGIQGG